MDQVKSVFASRTLAARLCSATREEVARRVGKVKALRRLTPAQKPVSMNFASGRHSILRSSSRNVLTVASQAEALCRATRSAARWTAASWAC